MAHDVSIKLATRTLAKDMELLIKKTKANGTTEKLGVLMISQGNVEWLPKGNSVNKKRLTWEKFAELLEGAGKTVKVKKK